MLLAVSSDVVTALGLQSTPGTLASAEAALNMAFPALESALETSLTYGIATDYYDYPAVPWVGETSVVTLRLSNRFPDLDTVKVYAFTSEGEELVPAIDYHVDYDRGLVSFLPSILPRKQSVRVSYEHGQEASPGQVPEYPSWVRQAAISTATLVLNTHPSSPANRKDKTVFNATTALYGYIRFQTQHYDRPRMAVAFPTRSVRVDG